jgi:hypothetical protein
MTPFLAGTLFGAVCAGALFLAFITRVRGPARQAEPRWDDPFEDPAPPQIITASPKLVRERHFQ